VQAGGQVLGLIGREERREKKKVMMLPFCPQRIL